MSEEIRNEGSPCCIIIGETSAASGTTTIGVPCRAYKPRDENPLDRMAYLDYDRGDPQRPISMFPTARVYLDPATDTAREYYSEAWCLETSRALKRRGDSGVDLICPEDLVVPARAGCSARAPAFKIDLGVRAVCHVLDVRMVTCDGRTFEEFPRIEAECPMKSNEISFGGYSRIEDRQHAPLPRIVPSGFWLAPRSSFSKTPLVMGNHLGLIDASYRGNLIAQVRNLDDEPFAIAAGTALFQLAAPSLAPPVVERYTPETRVTYYAPDSKKVVGDPFAATERGAGGFGSTG